MHSSGNGPTRRTIQDNTTRLHGWSAQLLGRASHHDLLQPFVVAGRRECLAQCCSAAPEHGLPCARQAWHTAWLAWLQAVRRGWCDSARSARPRESGSVRTAPASCLFLCTCSLSLCTCALSRTNSFARELRKGTFSARLLLGDSCWAMAATRR